MLAATCRQSGITWPALVCAAIVRPSKPANSTLATAAFDKLKSLLGEEGT